VFVVAVHDRLKFSHVLCFVSPVDLGLPKCFLHKICDVQFFHFPVSVQEPY
jgi:hypothetical protein